MQGTARQRADTTGGILRLMFSYVGIKDGFRQTVTFVHRPGVRRADKVALYRQSATSLVVWGDPTHLGCSRRQQFDHDGG